MKQHNVISASENDFQEKTLEHIDVLNLLPQRPPFIMIDHLIHFDPIITQTHFTIRKDNMFLQPDGHYEEAGLVETIAQSCAARMTRFFLSLYDFFTHNRGKLFKIGRASCRERV